MNKLFTLFSIGLVFCLEVSAQGQDAYYVVAGSFAIEENAARFESHVQAMNYPARQAYNSRTNLHYVYVSVNKEKAEASDIATRLRKQNVFKDAWVYNGPFAANTIFADARSENTSRMAVGHGMAGDPMAYVATVRKPQAIEASNNSDRAARNKTTYTAENKVIYEQRAFVFELLNAATGAPVDGNVKLIGATGVNAVQEVKANETVLVDFSSRAKKHIAVVCDKIGYMPQETAISFEKMKNGSNENGSQVLALKLEPVKRGDCVDLFGVKFYPESAVVTSESEAKLQELLEFMRKSNFKIRLLGHLKPGAPGAFMVGEGNDFFATLSGDRKMSGTARALSKYRADVIKSYLVSNGIDARRITTKGYGTTLPMYKEKEANERIEMVIR